MNPQRSTKKYARTGTVIGNGYFNTTWDAAAPTMGDRAYHKVGPKTDFAKAHQEDTIAFTITRYANGTPYKSVPYAVQGRQGDNSPNFPINSIVNGLPGEDPEEVDDQIQVMGLNLGEGAVQMGGSGRTHNIGEYEFPPGCLIGARVPKNDKWPHKEQQIDRDNVHLEPYPLTPHNIRTSLLDRGRMYRALRDLTTAGTQPVFPLNPNGVDPRPPARSPFTKDQKEILNVLLNQLYVTTARNLLDPATDLQQEIDAKEQVKASIAASGTIAVAFAANGALARRYVGLNQFAMDLYDAYDKENSGASVNYGKAIIEPLEAYTVACIDRKNNALRKVLGMSVAPIHSTNPMIALNLLSKSL